MLKPLDDFSKDALAQTVARQLFGHTPSPHNLTVKRWLKMKKADLLDLAGLAVKAAEAGAYADVEHNALRDSAIPARLY